MNVKTYVGTNFSNVRALVSSVMNDLQGLSIAVGDVAPTNTAYMRIIHQDSNIGGVAGNVIICEANVHIDPYADPTGANTNEYDPWRICFNCYEWSNRPRNIGGTLYYDDFQSYANGKNGGVSSLAIYVGTPATLTTNNSKPVIGYRTTAIRKASDLAEVWGWYVDDSNGNRTQWEPYDASYRARNLIEPVGNTGAEWTNQFDPTPSATKRSNPINQGWVMPQPYDGPDAKDASQIFVNRRVTYANVAANLGGSGVTGAPVNAQTLSYRLVLSDHGMFLGIWGPDPEENGSGFSWVLVQRPVDKRTGIPRGLDPTTGLPYTTITAASAGTTVGNRPLFCVNSVNGKFWKFVVRERDQTVPGSRKDATVNTEDSGAVINPYQQQSLTEDGEYVITFLNNLNSSRFKYGDELDMVGTVSSDVVGGGSEIDVNVYDEKTTSGDPSMRKYHALWSSGSYGTKMRIMVVQDIPDPNL